MSENQDSSVRESTAPNSGKSWFWFTATLTVLVAILGWQLYCNKQQLARVDLLHRQVSDNTRELAMSKPLLQQLAASVSSQESATTGLKKVEEELKANQQEMQKLQEQAMHENREDWMLLEVGYRINLASFKLNIEDDPKTTSKILAAVDARLAQSNQPALKVLRQAVSDDLLALNALAPEDNAGVMLKLRSLGKEVASLPLVSLAKDLDEPTADTTNAKTGTVSTANTWKQNFLNSLAKIADMVRIRKRDTPLGPLLAPNQEKLIVQNMQLMISEAEIALLQKNGELYREIVAELQEWLKTYFAQDAKPVQVFADELAKLSTFTFGVYPTDLHKSQEAINALVNEHFAPAPKSN